MRHLPWTLILLVGLATACTRSAEPAQRVEQTPISLPSTTTSAAPTTTQPHTATVSARSVPRFEPVEWYTSAGLLEPEAGGFTERAPAAIGAEETFLVGDEQGTSEITAELIYANDVVAMWVESGVAADPAAYQFAADAFAREVVPPVTALFGDIPSPGVDGDPRISVLHVQTLGDAAGEFTASDLLPQTVAPASNERELLYVSLEQAVIGSDGYLATMAHELQHLLEASSGRNVPLWLSEGMAQLAERVAGYDSVGTDTTFLATPSVQLDAWGALQTDGRHYGAGYLFTLYLWERFGDDMIRAINDSPAYGLGSVAAALETEGVSLEWVFGDWMVANYLDAPTVAPEYGYEQEELGPVCPVPDLHELDVEQRFDTPQYAPRYHRLEGSGTVTLQFDGGTASSVIDDLPHCGEWLWWSGRTDGSAPSLTREFDLTEVERATLEFRIWHDAGAGDGGVVTVSTDRGASWQMVGGRHAVADSEGIPWYTGASGRGAEPVWIRDEIDLSPYTGGTVQVRFQHVTDLFESRFGMGIDEVEVPEIGFADGAELDDGHWALDGFVRAEGRIPQEWHARIIRPDTGAVESLPIAAGTGTIDIVLDHGPAVVAVAAMAPDTSLPAEYRLTASGTAELAAADAGGEFSDECGDWDVDFADTYALRLEDERMAIDLREPDVLTWSSRRGYTEDVTISAVAEFGAGTGLDGAAGLMCRTSNAGFYDFEISSDGWVFAGVAGSDGYEVLSDWEQSDAVQTGDGARNELVLDCRGDQLRFSVNGTPVIELEDDRLTGGRVAVSGGSFSDAGFTVWFEDVDVAADPLSDRGDLIGFDDFEEGAGAWAVDEGARAAVGVRDGLYVTAVRPSDWFVEGFAGVDVADFIVDVDATVLENTPDGSIALSCRNTPNGDQYLFFVGLDGFVSISAFVDGEFTSVADWRVSSEVDTTAGAVNHLRMECIGSTLRLAINGVVVIEGTDDRLTTGDVGLGAYTFEYGGYAVAFDDVLIRSAS